MSIKGSHGTPCPVRQELLTKAPVLYTPPGSPFHLASCIGVWDIETGQATNRGTRPVRMLSVQAKQATSFRDSLLWIKRHGRGASWSFAHWWNERHLRLVLWALCSVQTSTTEAYGFSRLSVITRQLTLKLVGLLPEQEYWYLALRSQTGLWRPMSYKTVLIPSISCQTTSTANPLITMIGTKISTTLICTACVHVGVSKWLNAELANDGHLTSHSFPEMPHDVFYRVYTCITHGNKYLVALHHACSKIDRLFCVASMYCNQRSSIHMSRSSCS